jgi:hypothetical protein
MISHSSSQRSCLSSKTGLWLTAGPPDAVGGCRGVRSLIVNGRSRITCQQDLLPWALALLIVSPFSHVSHWVSEIPARPTQTRFW